MLSFQYIQFNISDTLKNFQLPLGGYYEQPSASLKCQPCMSTILTPGRLYHTVDWAYSTEEEPHLNNRRISMPFGKVLGGSSSINFLMYVRGNPADYDQWQILGNQGCSYADVLSRRCRIMRARPRTIVVEEAHLLSRIIPPLIR
jgi:choline dehydrogenase-like flavoprotein